MIIFAVLFVLGIFGTCSAQTGYELSALGYGYNAPEVRGDASFLNEQSEDPLSVLARNIPGGGVPGSDYPILSSVPDTGFTCEDQEFPGYFADTADEVGCQVFHICQFDGRLDSFLCPNGTIFNQQYFVCDWWNNVDCSMSEQFRSLNAEIGKIMEDTADSFRSDVVDPSQLYGVPQQRQTQTPTQTYSAPQQRLSQTPAQTYSAPQQRLSQTPAQTYSAPEERQSVPAPSQSYNGPQERQVPVPAPVQFYNAPQERQSVLKPSQSYGTPQDRQATVPPPSQFYNSPSRF